VLQAKEQAKGSYRMMCSRSSSSSFRVCISPTSEADLQKEIEGDDATENKKPSPPKFDKAKRVTIYSVEKVTNPPSSNTFDLSAG